MSRGATIFVFWYLLVLLIKQPMMSETKQPTGELVSTFLGKMGIVGLLRYIKVHS